MTRGGFTGIGLIFCCGLWLVAAPFVLRYQPAGGRWVLDTEASVITGSILALAGFAAFFLVIAWWVRELYAVEGRGPAARRDARAADAADAADAEAAEPADAADAAEDPGRAVGAGVSSSGR